MSEIQKYEIADPEKLATPRHCAVLIEDKSFNLSELNQSNCFSSVWTQFKGKPLIYSKINTLIEYGFKQFIIALLHVDQIIKEQIKQLGELHQDCIFKCIKINDLCFFETHVPLTNCAQKYLQRYFSHSLDALHSSDAVFLWIEKIKIQNTNPLEYFNGSNDTQPPILWVKQKNSHDELEKIGLWLNIKHLAEQYQSAKNDADISHRHHLLFDSFERMNQNEKHVISYVHPISSLPATTRNEDNLVASRCFNEMIIDNETGVITKRSSQTKKMQQEIDFYRLIPKPLKVYFPRMIEAGRLAQNNNAPHWYSLEYYPYKSLSQYFVYYILPLDCWQALFERLLGMHEKFLQHNDPFNKQLDHQALYQFYIEKLDSRIKMAKKDTALKKLLDLPIIHLNGEELHGLNHLEHWLNKRLFAMCDHIDSKFVHGDLCFSNILFEPASHLIRLIDPRGEFMGSVNHGDPRYDLAKILHSAHGRYDFIIHDLFTLTQDQDHFEFYVPQSPYLQQLTELLFEQLELKTNYPINDLIILESLLFLTMLPLHSDYPKRQVAFFLTGLKLLNQVYREETQATPVAAIQAEQQPAKDSTTIFDTAI